MPRGFDPRARNQMVELIDSQRRAEAATNAINRAIGDLEKRAERARRAMASMASVGRLEAASRMLDHINKIQGKSAQLQRIADNFKKVDSKVKDVGGSLSGVNSTASGVVNRFVNMGVALQGLAMGYQVFGKIKEGVVGLNAQLESTTIQISGMLR